MKEKPILFSSEMVRAILDGRKTQTRRVIKPQPTGWLPEVVDDIALWYIAGDQDYSEKQRSPYGKPGDLLWVRETWSVHKYMDDTKPSEFTTAAQMLPVYYRADNKRRSDDQGKWRPSIFMPRWASRITLRVTNVRVERVQDISNDDAKAEGVNAWADVGAGLFYWGAFEILWNSINAKRGYSWDSNPWVWVIEFEEVGT